MRRMHTEHQGVSCSHYRSNTLFGIHPGDALGVGLSMCADQQ